MAHVQQNSSHDAIFPTFGKRWSGRIGPRRASFGIFAALITWQQRLVERQQLANMSDFHLKDIGLSRADADLESSKPFWQA